MRLFTNSTKNFSLLAVELNELADRAVVGLMTAAHPPRSDVTARQAFQLTQRPLPVEDPVDHQPEHHARMQRAPPVGLIGLHVCGVIEAFQQ
jgi:hypothetical protein